MNDGKTGWWKRVEERGREWKRKEGARNVLMEVGSASDDPLHHGHVAEEPEQVVITEA